MGNIVCPHNQNGCCCSNSTPISMDEDRNMSCERGECLYIIEANRIKTVRDNTDSFEQRLSSIEEALYLTDEDGTNSVAQIMEWVRQNLIDENGAYNVVQIMELVRQNLRDGNDQESIAEILSWIRANIGSMGDEPSISSKLDDIYNRLDSIDDHAKCIDDNTFRF